MPSGDASTAAWMNELLGSGLLHVTLFLLPWVAVTSTELSKMPSEANMVVTGNANYNKRGFFWLVLRDMGFVFVWFCVTTTQSCLCKSYNSALGLYFKWTHGEWDWPTPLSRTGPVSVYPSFAFLLKKKLWRELENKSLGFQCRKGQPSFSELVPESLPGMTRNWELAAKSWDLILFFLICHQNDEGLGECFAVEVTMRIASTLLNINQLHLENQKWAKNAGPFFNLPLFYHHSEGVLTVTVYVILYSKY